MLDSFSLEGVVPMAYALFAAALVISIGLVLRRTAAAIGLALVLFFAARVAIENWARPNYAEPLAERWVEDARAEADLRGAWVFSEANELRITGGGQPDPTVVQSCVTDVAGKGLDGACLAEHGIVAYTNVLYHSASRFCLFQSIEAGIFAALTAALLAFSVRWIRKRIS
jgi:hypothetical protein